MIRNGSEVLMCLVHEFGSSWVIGGCLLLLKLMPNNTYSDIEVAALATIQDLLFCDMYLPAFWSTMLTESIVNWWNILPLVILQLQSALTSRVEFHLRCRLGNREHWVYSTWGEINIEIETAMSLVDSSLRLIFNKWLKDNLWTWVSIQSQSWRAMVILLYYCLEISLRFWTL